MGKSVCSRYFFCSSLAKAGRAVKGRFGIKKEGFYMGNWGIRKDLFEGYQGIRI